MAFFKLNIYGINDNVERHVRYSNGLKEQSDLVYNSLLGVDSYWNDPNTLSFISRIKKDGYRLSDYIIYLNNMYREVANFNENVKNTCAKYGYKSVREIKFNDARLADCVRYLNQAIEILNNNLRRLNSLTFDVQYASLSSVYEKVAQINKLISLIENLKNDISGFCTSVNSCVVDSRVRKSKIEKRELGISLVEYGWSLTERVNRIDKVDTNVGLVASKSTIDLSQRDNNVSPVVGMSTSNQQFSVDNKDGVNLGYNSVNYGGAASTDINYQHNKSGLQYSANYYAIPNDQESVNIIDRDNTLNTVNGFGGNSQQIGVANKNDINLDYNSVNYVASNGKDIDYQYGKDGLQYGVNSYNQPNSSNNVNINNMDNTLNVPNAYNTRMNSGINVNHYDNKVSVNSINMANVQNAGMNFSNGMNNVDLNSKFVSFNTPQNVSIMGSIGGDKNSINNNV